MIFSYLIPTFVIIVFLVCFCKKVPVYDGFMRGVKKSLPLIYAIFPYLVGISLLTEIFTISGISQGLTKLLSPLLNKVGINSELVPLIILKPFSGSGSLSYLATIYQNFGADSYIARCASCIYGSSETIFYVSSVYFATCKNKKIFLPVLIAIISSLCSVLVVCLICRFI